MAGNANQKIQSARGAAPFGYGFDRQGFLPEMNSPGIRRQRGIQPVIDEYTRSSRARFGNCEPRKIHKSTRFKILLTNLNPTGACGGRAPDGIVKQVRAKRAGVTRERTGWTGRRFKRAPVRYVAENWFTSGLQRSPSVPAAC